MTWLSAAMIITILDIILMLVISCIYWFVSGKNDSKRTMGAISIATKDLTRRSESWKNALLNAHEEEKYDLEPIQGFVYAELSPESAKNSKQVLEYGIAIGYAPSFLTTPIKQVSYILLREEIDYADNTALIKSKISQRQNIIRKIHNHFEELVNCKTQFSSLEINTPCVLPDSYEYLL